MAQWKPLPDGLEPRLRQLVVRLRELKDQTGIGTAALARKTAYSRSSWHRYLHAKLLPPRQAVEALGRLAGADQARLLALWELAERAEEERRAAADGEPAPEAAGAVARHGRRRRPLVVAAGVAGIVVAAAVGLTVWFAAGRPPSSRLSSAAGPTSYTCEYTTRDGRLYAGHSDTSDRLVALNAGSQDVVEVQCLLRHHGIDPGRIDGLYGRHTEQAVQELQRAAGLVADGIVGPRTWAVLRA